MYNILKESGLRDPIREVVKKGYPMYRILLASSGYYYVQQHSSWHGWTKIGGFFRTRAGAKRFLKDFKYYKHEPFSQRVVEYVY